MAENKNRVFKCVQCQKCTYNVLKYCLRRQLFRFFEQSYNVIFHVPPNCCAFPKNREPLPSSKLSPGALKRKGQISVTSVSYHIIANYHNLLQCIRSHNKQRTIGDAAWRAVHLQWHIAQCHVYIYWRVQIWLLSFPVCSLIYFITEITSKKRNI